MAYGYFPLTNRNSRFEQRLMKIDLHTHSISSKDGGLTEKDYEKLISSKQLDIIAITDHNKVDFAIKMQEKFPNNIIVGEEIMTSEGEIIGLFLEHIIPAGLSPHETVTIIKERGGLVYIPHPFERVRSGLSDEVMQSIISDIDIVELANGRTIQNKTQTAQKWLAGREPIVAASSSDAHSLSGTGRTYTTIEDLEDLNADSLLKALAGAQLEYAKPPLSAFLAPKINSIKRPFRR